MDKMMLPMISMTDTHVGLDIIQITKHNVTCVTRTTFQYNDAFLLVHVIPVW